LNPVEWQALHVSAENAASPRVASPTAVEGGVVAVAGTEVAVAAGREVAVGSGSSLPPPQATVSAVIAMAAKSMIGRNLIVIGWFPVDEKRCKFASSGVRTFAGTIFSYAVAPVNGTSNQNSLPVRPLTDNVGIHSIRYQH
jgi:hypothetical protein